MPLSVLLWGLFGLVVVGMMALDLGVFHRKSHTVSVREALVWSVVWISLALLFNLVVFLSEGPVKGLEFFTAYLIEESLSVDNLFVFLVIFSYFCVPGHLRHRVLFWGIIGAVIMRALFIGAGVVLISRFHWVIYVFGAFLVVSGIRMAFKKDEEVHPEKNVILKLFKKFFPVEHDFENGKFFVKKDGRWTATTLFVVLLVVETTDLIFAVDSVPAVLAITNDPLIAYTSNIFAILGLRSLFFALAGVMEAFHYLHYGLAGIFVFIGVKMLTTDLLHIQVGVSLGVVAALMGLSVAASLIWPAKKEVPSCPPEGGAP